MAVPALDDAPVTPIVRALDAVRARHGSPAVHGVAPSVVVANGSLGWRAAIDADELLAAARRRWPAPAEPHVAAALAWKSYAYGAMLPYAIGFATASVVPTGRLLARLHGHDPFVEFGLSSGEAATGTDADLTATIRDGVYATHLVPLVDALHTRVRIGRRTLLGSVASGVCHALARASDLVPGGAVPMAYKILGALDLADLVDFYPGDDGRLIVARRTCCLAFALPQPKICTGCCITSAT